MRFLINPQDRSTWQVPNFEKIYWDGKKSSHCIVIPVINEGTRIHNLLDRIRKIGADKIADLIIVDGGSTDNSLEPVALKNYGVRALLLKTGQGKLGAQLRCAYAFALDQGYEGIVTIDGNNKDDPSAIQAFINSLKDGWDFVQASRFIPGGTALNTPISRNFGIRFIHAPVLSLFSGFAWTDTTQGFRAYSRKMLLSSDISIFRDIFSSYELLAYLSYRAPRMGYKCIELPTSRQYPKGNIPTKISTFKGNFLILKILILTCTGFYNPKN